MKLRIKYLRQALGLTQSAFAAKAHVHKNMIANYESKNSNPSLKQIEKIALAFNVEPAWLAGWDTKPQIVIKEKVVRVQEPSARIPNDWKNDECGRLIKWKESGKQSNNGFGG